MNTIIKTLIASPEPCIEYYAKKYLCDSNLSCAEEKALLNKIRESALVRALLSEMNADGIIPCHPYKKWYGAHWVLLSLADVNYPQHDPEISNLVDQTYNWIFSPVFQSSVKEIKGLVRGHSCIVGNALYYMSKLGYIDERLADLKTLLLKMQWRDGGWNCDNKPKAHTSSFNPTAIAVRGLNQYRIQTGDDSVSETIEQGICYMTERELCRRKSTGEILHSDILRFFYPEYYHYSILYALRVLMEAGYHYNEKLEFALHYIEEHKKDYGFSISKKYYWKAKKDRAGKSLVNWGSLKDNEMNAFVTMYAVHVLKYFRNG